MLEIFNIHEGDLAAFSKHADGVLIKLRRLVASDEVINQEEEKIVRRGSARPLRNLK